MDKAQILATVWVLIVFTAVFLMAIAVNRSYGALVRRRQMAKVLRSGGGIDLGRPDGEKASSGKFDALLDLFTRFSLPDDAAEASQSSDKFVRAGLSSPSIRTFYYAARTVGALAFPCLVFLLFLVSPGDRSPSTMGLYYVGSAALGYYLPEMYLSHRISERRKAILLAMPDFLDLMVVCAEAGLGFDAAINRVAKELATSSPALADEFTRLGLEIRAGAARSVALKNIANRIDLPEMSTLIAMLIQADKLGVSLVTSLKTNADLLRVRRLTKAEELAAKIPVKITIPLFLFIFPTMFIIILGPAGIRMAATLAEQ